MKKSVVLAALVVAAVSSTAMAQFRIRAGGIAGNGEFFNGAFPANITGAHANANLLRPGSATDNMFASRWHWRTGGDTRERSFGAGSDGGWTMTGVTVGDATGNLTTGGYDFVATNTANGLGFNSNQRWSITNVGGLVTVVATNTITNTVPGTVLEMSIFNFADIDVNGSFAHPWSFDGTQFVMSSGAVDATFGAAGFNAFQAVTFNSLGASLTDAAINNLNNTIGAPPGDFTGAFQWNAAIPGGQSVTFAEYFTVPAPGALALLGLGGLAAARRRRN